MAKSVDLSTVGGRIRYKRIKAGLTQEQLAEILFVTPAAVSTYENRDLNIPSKTVMDIAKVLNTTAGYLLDGVENVISTEEMEILAIFNSLRDKVKAVALTQIKALANM